MYIYIHIYIYIYIYAALFCLLRSGLLWKVAGTRRAGTNQCRQSSYQQSSSRILSFGSSESNLGLYMTTVLATRMRLRSANFRRIWRSDTFSNQKSAMCSRIPERSLEIMNFRTNFWDFKSQFLVCTSRPAENDWKLIRGKCIELDFLESSCTRA